MSPPSSSSSSSDPRNRFWPVSSPLSTRCREDIAGVISRRSARCPSNATRNSSSSSNHRRSAEVEGEHSRANGTKRNGLPDNNNIGIDKSAPGNFRIPGAQDVPRYSRRNGPADTRSERDSPLTTSKNLNNIGMIAKPRIGQAGWRNISKTCDCIEKGGKTSPRLAQQARAVSSPDPLHRPETPRASLLSTTAAQTLR